MLKIVDDDIDTITAVLGGRVLRTWTYADEEHRRFKMRLAREYQAGWSDCQLNKVETP